MAKAFSETAKPGQLLGFVVETVRKLFVDFDVNGLHRRRTF